MKHLNLKLLTTFICLAGFANSQIVTTLAGGFTGNTDANGIGTAASFDQPIGVATDGAGNLYVADQLNDQIRKIDISTAAVTVLAGGFNEPTGVVYDGSGNLYVADWSNNEIRKVVISTGVVTTLAGAGSGYPGSTDGTGTAAKFKEPYGITYDGSGNLYVADMGNNEIRKIVISSAVVTTLAGSTTAGSANGTGTAARFNYPFGLTTDGKGNLYVADYANNEIRQIVISSGVVTTLAGSTTASSADGIGTAAGFSIPYDVVCDGNGNLYVADGGNQEIRKIVISSASVTTLAGSTTAGNGNGTGTAASFHQPSGITIDASGNLYVADEENNLIRMISSIPTSMNELAPMPASISLYPNPANNLLYLSFNMQILSDAAVIKVIDITGREVLSKNSTVTNGNLIPIDIGTLTQGIYFVKAITDQTTLVAKFIKE